MQLDLTKKQLKTLLEVVYLGNWMINAQRDGSKKDPIMQEHDDMAKFIYSKAGEAGLKQHVQYDKEMKKWFPTQYLELDSEVTKFHLEYNNNTFWEALIDRLGSRDLSKLYKLIELQDMSIFERMNEQAKCNEKYEIEFEKNGIDRLVIDETVEIRQKIQRNDPCPCGSNKKFKKCCGR
jgi:preprotein translocase subunit SecA